LVVGHCRGLETASLIENHYVEAPALKRQKARCIIPGIVYAQFFGLNRLPFRLRPDAEFLYSGAEYLRARASLLKGLKERARVLLLLGPPGVGKTMLLDDVLKILGTVCLPCRINQPQISAKELLEALILQLGPSATEVEGSPTRSYAELAASLHAIGANSAMPLLIVDDAQLLPVATAQALTDVLTRAPTIKIVLVGRQGAGLEETAARFLAGQEPRMVRLAPLSKAESRAYIDHRLSVAGSGKRDLIAGDAYSVIFQQTAGSPRLTNLLCDAAFHAACLRASGQVGSAEVLQATQDSRWPEALARDRSGAHPGAQEIIQEPEISQPSEPRQAQLVVSLGQLKLSTWPLPPGRVTIGRAADNLIRLEAKFVSRHHCQVTTAGAVSTIEDLDSVNGISVNGKLVKRHVLKHADQIQLGDHTLTYVFGPDISPGM
jgi:type II secretory pathway predicted ATPase ExeA